MVTEETIFVCRVIVSCRTLVQLTAAERLMINAGKDLTNLVEAKRQQLETRLSKNANINKAMNQRLNNKVKGHES